jgi:AFG3 family protein
LQISFQEFKNKLLEPGLVDHIVVANKSVAKVYVRSSPSSNQGPDGNIHITTSHLPGTGSPSKYKYYFNIGSVDSFEEKLEEAQQAMGRDPHVYVPVTYTSEVNWFQELMRFAPTVLLVGLIYVAGKKMKGGISIGGPGGGARGIFNIGKAQVTKMDKNSKNKVVFVCCSFHGYFNLAPDTPFFLVKFALL